MILRGFDSPNVRLSSGEVPLIWKDASQEVSPRILANLVAELALGQGLVTPDLIWDGHLIIGQPIAL